MQQHDGELMVTALESLARLSTALNQLDDKRAAAIKALDAEVSNLRDDVYAIVNRVDAIEAVLPDD